MNLSFVMCIPPFSLSWSPDFFKMRLKSKKKRENKGALACNLQLCSKTVKWFQDNDFGKWQDLRSANQQTDWAPNRKSSHSSHVSDEVLNAAGIFIFQLIVLDCFYYTSKEISSVKMKWQKLKSSSCSFTLICLDYTLLQAGYLNHSQKLFSVQTLVFFLNVW